MIFFIVVKQMTREDPLKVFSTFVLDYKKFKDKGDKYLKQGELEGALITYNLAANSLHHALQLDEHDKMLEQVKKE